MAKLYRIEPQRRRGDTPEFVSCEPHQATRFALVEVIKRGKLRFIKVVESFTGPGAADRAESALNRRTVRKPPREPGVYARSLTLAQYLSLSEGNA